MNFSRTIVSAPLVGCVIGPTICLAQELSPSPEDDVYVVSEWNHDHLFQSGTRVRSIIESGTVETKSGASLGSIQDFRFTTDGEIHSVLMEATNGSSPRSLPWNQLNASTGSMDFELVKPAMDERRSGDSVETFRASDLIGHYASLSSTEEYVHVNDLLVDSHGRIRALIINAAAYGTPDFGEYSHPDLAREGMSENPWSLSYSEARLDALDRFDYELLRYGLEEKVSKR